LFEMLKLPNFVCILFLCLLCTVQAAHHFEIINNCPFRATIYINGQSQGQLLALGGRTSRDFPDDWSGFIYTDLNRGNPAGPGTTRAGFYGPSNYYYIVRDPNWINVDVDIKPINAPSRMGFCVNADCAYNNCPDAYTSPPTRFPNPGTVAPQPPLYGCPHTPSGFTVTFCPTGEIPNYQSRPDFINPNGNPNKCLDVKGGVFANGTPVQIYDCNGSQAQMWSIIRGSGMVHLSGTNYCLDAGSSPGNGAKMKIWTCYEGLAAQQWYWTDNNHIMLTGKGLCLDLTNGKLDNGNTVQTWQCSDGNKNQIWT